MFAGSRILPSLKRRSKAHSKAALHVTPTRGTSLDILPELDEEEEAKSCSSIQSMPAHARTHSATPSHLCVTTGDAAERKRSSRRVVLTGAEGLTFEDFFPPSCSPTPPRPAPAPPLYGTMSRGESPLDSIDLRFSGLGISLDFPSPPLEPLSLNASPVQSPLAARRRERSPSPSVSSATTTSSSMGSSKGFGSPRVWRDLFTPPTSDDDSLPTTPTRPHLMRSPSCKSRRASIFFAQSMPDLSQLLEESDNESVESDVEWYAHDISDTLTLSTPLPPSFPAELAASTSKDPKARPDSIMPVKRVRYNKALPDVPPLNIQAANGDASVTSSPSAQLDPTFAQARRRRSFLIPTRPPPPPIRIITCAPSSSYSPASPTVTEMEAHTEELLAELASAAMNSGFLGTGLAAPYTPGPWSASTAPPSPSSMFVVPPSASSMRPPPRMSLPIDISEGVPELVIDGSASPESEAPSTPGSVSVYSQQSSRKDGTMSPVSSFSFDVDVSLVDGSTPVSENADVDLPATPDSPNADAVVFAPERVLRSRWSTSTLSSHVHHGHSASTLSSRVQAEREAFSWISRLTLSPAKKAPRKHVPPALPSPKSPTKMMSAFVLPSPKSPTRATNPKRYGYVDPARHRALERRDSRASRMSESSVDSESSSRSDGLRRKPIPVEMFLRT